MIKAGFQARRIRSMGVILTGAVLQGREEPAL